MPEETTTTQPIAANFYPFYRTCEAELPKGGYALFGTSDNYLGADYSINAEEWMDDSAGWPEHRGMVAGNGSVVRGVEDGRLYASIPMRTFSGREYTAVVRLPAGWE